MSAAIESVLTVVNSAVAATQKIPESQPVLQYGCRETSKRVRMFINVGGIALAGVTKARDTMKITINKSATLNNGLAL